MYDKYKSILKAATQLSTLDIMVQKHSKEISAPYNRGADCYGLAADLYANSSHSRAEALFQAAYDREYEILNPAPVEHVSPLSRSLSDALSEAFA